MIIEINDIQLPNDETPILVTLPGIMTEANNVQLLNAVSPILVTVFGMVTEVDDNPIGYLNKVDWFLLYKTPFTLE